MSTKWNRRSWGTGGAAMALVLLAGLFLAAPGTGATGERRGEALLLTIDGVISPLAARYLERGLQSAEERGAEVVILRLNTPGGLESAMRQMTQALLGSSVPVAVYVAPSGARAASAGMFVTLAAHVAAMAPGTNIGAAHPVALGGESDAVSAENLILLGLPILLILGLVAAAVRIVPEYQRLVVFRLGRAIGARGPGLVLLIPVVDQGVRVELRERFFDVPPQTTITEDNAHLSIDFLVYLEAEGYALALEQIFAVARNVDSKTLSLQYLEALKALGAGPSTKWVLPMELTNLLRPFVEHTGSAAEALSANGPSRR